MVSPRTRLGWVIAAAGALAPASGLWGQAENPARIRLLDLNRIGQSALSPYLDAQSFAVAGRFVYFPAWSFAEGYELWRSDGTAAGTSIVADLVPGTLSSGPGQLVAVGGRMCFVATDVGGIPQIYIDRISDGAAAARLSNFTLDDNALPGLIGAAGDTLIYSAPLGDQIGVWGIDVRQPAATPALLTRLVAGPVGLGFGGSDAVSVGSQLYFVGDDGVHGRELWITDGTPAGTHLLVDLMPGPAGSDPTALAGVSGRVFLSAFTPQSGREPWVCDAQGPRMIGDLNTSGTPAAGSLPEGFALVGSSVVFVAGNATHGRELWVTSATGDPATTRLLLDIAPGPADGIPGPFRPRLIGQHLYFAARDAASGIELWRTDGTPEGTVRHADVRPGPSSSEPVQLLESAGRLVFQAVTDDTGYRLWIAEPVAGGLLGAPRQLSNLAFSDDDAINRTSPRPCAHLPALGGVLVFPGFRQSSGLELYRIASPTGYAELVHDIRLGTLGSSPTQLARLGNGAVFSARNELGVEPWISTGHSAGTRPLADLMPGRSGSNPGPFLAAQAAEATLFRAGSTSGGQWFQALARPSPTLVPLGIAEPQQSISPRSCALGDLAIFAARRGDTGDEPFLAGLGALGPTPPQLLADIAPGVASSSPFFFTRVDHAAMFFAAAAAGAGGASVELWRVDAGPGDVRRVARLSNPVGPRVISTANRPVSVGSCLFFVADDGSGDELWVSRVDTGQTFRVADIEPGPLSSFPTSLTATTAADGEPRLVFVAQRIDLGAEVWAARITPQGVTATLVMDLFPGQASSSPVSLVSPRDNDGRPLPGAGVYFSATDGVSGRQLWFTSGEPEDMRRLTHFNPATGAAVQAVLGIAGHSPRRAYFRLLDPTASPGGTSPQGVLYRTDSSVTGAAPVLTGSGEPIAPGSTLLEVNNRIYLSVTDRLAGSELAVIDLCPADFDNSGSIEIGDLLDFLGSWLATYGQSGPLAADASYDGRVDMTDLFTFLDSYFRGCR